MAEQLLDDAQIGAVIEQVGGATVPQDVRRQLMVSVETGPCAVLLDDRPRRLAGQPTAPRVEEHGVGIVAPSPLRRAPDRGGHPARTSDRGPPPPPDRTARCAPWRPCRTVGRAGRRSRCRPSTGRTLPRSAPRCRRATRASARSRRATDRRRSRPRAGRDLPSASALGIPAGTRRPSTSAVGSSRRRSSLTRKRWSERIAASCRAIVDGALPCRRRAAISSKRSAVRHRVQASDPRSRQPARRRR